jgi:hypothetical protein
MIATQTSPSTLRTAVRAAVREGAWSPADVVASVATDYGADRGRILATLWDLVDEGLLAYDPALQLGLGGFRPL